MINFEDPYVYLPIIIFCIIIILFLTDTIKLNFTNQQEGFRGEKELDNNLSQLKSVLLLSKDTDKIDVQKINNKIDMFVKYEEMHALSTIQHVGIWHESKGKGASAIAAEKHFGRYKDMKEIFKNSIKYLENSKKRNSRSTITANDNDEFLEEGFSV
jgi:hypothetical protein